MGQWWVTASGNASLAVQSIPASSWARGMNFVLPFTSGAGAVDAAITSPVVDVSNKGCNSKYDVVFTVYTSNCTTGDNILLI